MQISTRTKGASTEDAALHFLLDKGYSFVAKNYFSKGGEIDLIVQKDDFTVFVEVKSLSVNSEYSIYESLTKAKKKRLKKVINKWLLENDLLEKPWRVDFIGILTEEDKVVSIEHFEFVSLN